MTRSLSAAALLLLLLAAAPAAAQEPGAKGVDDAWVAAVKSGNVEAVVALYAPDAVMYAPDAMESHGTAAIRAGYTNMLGAMTVLDATMDTHYETVGDLSVGYGTATLTMQPKAGGGGAPSKMTVRVTAVAKRINGKWLYIADHASIPAGPAK
jgi:uncharacterized protein (TIGR02246 family)